MEGNLTMNKAKTYDSANEITAFQADVERAKRLHKIESGQITPEEERERNEFLDFMGFPEKKTHFHDGKNASTDK